MKELSELSAPKDIKRKLLEKDVQRASIEWARKRGWWARKFASQSQRSVPDYLLAHPCGDKFAVEFKAPGKTSTEAQREEQEAMKLAGWDVWECDSFEKFKTWVEELEGAC